MAWIVKLADAAKKDLGKLDKQVAKRIIDFLTDRISTLDNPRSIGKALKGLKLGEFWCYRVGD